MNLIEDLVIQEIVDSELANYGVIVPSGVTLLEKAASILETTRALRKQGAVVFSSFPEIIFGSDGVMSEGVSCSKEASIHRLKNPVYRLQESDSISTEAAQLFEITPHDRELLKSGLKGATEDDITFLREAGLIEDSAGGNPKLTEFASAWMGLKRVHQ
jgi:hypothetical protein